MKEQRIADFWSIVYIRLPNAFKRHDSDVTHHTSENEKQISFLTYLFIRLLEYLRVFYM